LVRGFFVEDLVFFGATCDGFVAGAESAESAIAINTAPSDTLRNEWLLAARERPPIKWKWTAQGTGLQFPSRRHIDVLPLKSLNRIFMFQYIIFGLD
jgi:hypothetical protein